jgi:hypothetical protein
MVLPELSWQFVYARLGWALVLAALVIAGWPAHWRLPRRVLGGVVTGCLVLTALPGEASAAWHLGLAFQYPSALLVGLCCVRLHARWHGAAGLRPASALPLPLAALLALGGTLLYLDAFGLLSRGYYYAGFGPGPASLLAMLLAIACAAGIVRGRSRPQACAALGALLLFSLARLPTGNLWDALLDPLLWGWALVSLGVAAPRALMRRRARLRLAPAEPGLQELPALRSAGAEPFSPIKE